VSGRKRFRRRRSGRGTIARTALAELRRRRRHRRLVFLMADSFLARAAAARRARGAAA